MFYSTLKFSWLSREAWEQMGDARRRILLILGLLSMGTIKTIMYRFSLDAERQNLSAQSVGARKIYNYSDSWLLQLSQDKFRLFHQNSLSHGSNDIYN